MKKALLTFMALFCLASVSSAQTAGMRISYCDGRVATSGTSGFNTSEKGTWVSGAIFVPAEQMGIYSKNRIEVIRAGLCSKVAVDSLKVWVRTSLDGDDLASGLLTLQTTPALNKGWNEVALETPYEIPEQAQGIYLGYSFHQKSSTYALSVIKDLAQANALWVQLGSSAQWQDRSTVGALSIEGIVRGDYLPKYNLALDAVHVPKFYGISSGKMDVTASVRNLATVTITGYKAVCKIDGYDQTCVAEISQPIAFEEQQSVKFTINPTMITTVPNGPLNITVTLEQLNEGDDEDMSDNTASTSFQVLEAAFPRKVLLEEFTTEVCPNCPRVANMIHAVIQKPEFSDVVTMEHHSGYYTDFLTTAFDRSFLWFYNNNGSTYAPAVMYDRTLVDSQTTPVSFPQTQNDMEKFLKQRLDEIGLVGINIEASYQEDGKLAVTVTGARASDNITKQPARITVFLVEDKIPARSQSGASGQFIHYNVGRDINSTWGTPITWDGNNYSYNCTFNVTDTYVKDNLAIIAMISDYNASDPTACGILNTEILRASDFGTSTPTNGDITGDGKVDVADINEAINVMLGKSTNAADVTGDNKVDVSDINRLINIMLGK